MRGIRRRVLPAVLAGCLLLIAGCATTQPVQPVASSSTGAPTGAGSATPGPDLAGKRQALGIAACPTTPRPAADGAASGGAAGGGAANGAAGDGVVKGAAADGLPAVATPCLDGSGPVDLSALRGTPMVVNLWATWCGPCRTEAPYLAEVSRQTGASVRFVGVDVADPDPAAALEFAGAQGWTYAQVADPERTFAGRLGVAGIPQTLLVDADGRIVYRHAGALTSADQLRGLLHDHLGIGE
ncbi:TlpA disulfide reductase family protein [Raineyella sp. LH-20]|uniref:TlpA family protein disulfide reductase n=1 Tax=Raineyella sp. LH-20 TaxID=3081204 RepID=UPI002955D9A1|nr:TlpA disulfide reductase family protein [Raineyella sp. LH-20]WOP19079.1 TlpA disulfide reductase family protein [Raineyella sp. LH-20]